MRQNFSSIEESVAFNALEGAVTDALSDEHVKTTVESAKRYGIDLANLDLSIVLLNDHVGCAIPSRPGYTPGASEAWSVLSTEKRAVIRQLFLEKLTDARRRFPAIFNN